MNRVTKTPCHGIAGAARRGIVVAAAALLLAGAGPVRTEPVSFEVAQPPPEQVDFEHLWDVTLRNETPDPKSVSFQVEARESKSGVVFTARTEQVALASGARRLSAQDITLSDVWCKNGYEAFATTGSSLPEGDYTYVVTSVATRKQAVLFLRVRVTKPVELVWPPDGVVVSDRQPVFAWGPPVMSGPKVEYQYVARVAEVSRGQSAASALSDNRPVFEVRGMQVTACRASAERAVFLPGRTYAWRVGVVETPGLSVDAARIQSRAGSFVYRPDVSRAGARTSFTYPQAGRAVTGLTSLVVESDVPDGVLCVLEYYFAGDSARGEWQVAGSFRKRKHSFVGMWRSDSAVIRAGGTFPSQCLLRATVLGRGGQSDEALLSVTVNRPPPPTRKGCGGCNQHPDE